MPDRGGPLAAQDAPSDEAILLAERPAAGCTWGCEATPAPYNDPSLRTVTVRDVPPGQRQPQASPPLLVYDPEVEQILARADSVGGARMERSPRLTV